MKKKVVLTLVMMMAAGSVLTACGSSKEANSDIVYAVEAGSAGEAVAAFRLGTTES